MKTQVLSREELDSLIVKALQLNKIEEGDVFIAGVTKAKPYNGIYKMCLEIVQARILPIHEVNLTTTIFPRDDKYRGTVLSDVRIKVEFTVEGFDSIFYTLTTHSDVNKKLTGTELFEKAKNLNNDEILGVFRKCKTIKIDNEIVIPKISIEQYSIKKGLHYIITNILDIDEIDRTPSQVEELISMTLVNNEGECMVDIHRNQVYQIKEFTHYDYYIHNGFDFGIKMPISKHYDYIFDMSTIHSISFQSDTCKKLSSNESMLWTPELIEKYEDKWEWNEISKNNSIPWTLTLINKYADKLSCSESIWNRLKPYIDDELIEEVFMKIN